MDEVAARALDAQVTGCAASHQRLLASLETLADEQCREPSLLPGWTRGHILSHLARNAESHVLMFSAATRGEESEQYPGGKPVRKAGIESGANRSAADLVSGLRISIYALEAAWASATATTWAGHGIKSHSDGSRVPIAALVLMRWCETEVHHADLNLGFTWRDWNPLFVRYDLDRQVMAWRARKPMGMTVLPDAVQRLSPNERLAWLYNRVSIDGVPAPDPY
ncbi:MAG: maleylpyruvate isomerase N-terminal domain-containing protein [Actinomycetota bacterium]